MLRGAIVGESLRVGAALDGVPLKVQKLERVDAGLAEQPAEWTLLWFEADDADADQLAEQLSSALEARGGWYADLHSDSEVIVVFAGRISDTGGAIRANDPRSPTTHGPSAYPTINSTGAE